ncbi:MAG TPA: tagaturonate reductase [Membranihabitans sp.]|nr:tagaturonate reductase [Membranihabitans sp.]
MKKLNRKKANLLTLHPERVLQFGGGNFLRGFVDWMIDVLNKESIFNGSVVVVKPTEGGEYTGLQKQDGLFHVVLDGIRDGEPVTRIDLVESVSRTIQPYRDWEDYLATARQPGMRYIVSNTTEAGIVFSERDQKDDNPPAEFPAKLTRWLYERFEYFSGSTTRGCIILPCELIEDNGTALQKAVLEYARHWDLDTGFEKWILENNYFYNTLVDRIVSGFPEGRAEELRKRTGYEDALMVAGEYYHSWIISGHPIIQSELRFGETDLNVKFVDDLSAYRELKVRVLNGAHTALVPVGYLAGYRTVDESLRDEKIEKYLTDLLMEEVRPTLESLLPSQEVDEFIRDVLDRFRNPVLAHQLLDISLNSFSKFKTRLLPTLLDYIRIKETVPVRILFSLTCLMLFYRGEFQDEVIPLRDDQKNIDFARETWLACEAEKIGLLTLVTQFLAKLGVNRDVGPYDSIRQLVCENTENILEEGVLDSLPWEEL